MMADRFKFPELNYEKIYNTKKAVDYYSKFIGSIRANMTPEQKNYWHISLLTGPQGFRTTPIPYEDGTFEISLNLISHSVGIASSTGNVRSIPLKGQSLSVFSGELLSVLETMNIKPTVDLEKFQDNSELAYDKNTASDIFRSYSLVDIMFKTFKGIIPFETSPVQLWPHHMDIAFTCYPGVDNKKIEQIGLGYLTGDETIEEPYFYITAYPELEDISDITLANDAYWNPDGWQGVVLKYKDLIVSDNPAENLMTYLENTYDQIMKSTK
ncbi:MAG: DUF5996 family protein [Thermodesulfobacteriota bacterium]